MYKFANLKILSETSAKTNDVRQTLSFAKNRYILFSHVH